MRLTQNCLDDWLENYDAFTAPFLFYATNYAKSVGYAFDTDFESLEIAHCNWVAQCHFWEKTLVMPNSKGLSHIKMMAILLTELSSIEWMKDLVEFDGEERKGGAFLGTPDERAETRADIAGGGGTFLAFEFAITVINYFEAKRIDREGPFCFRATQDVLHDILVYLSSEYRHAMSTFLILTALYARPHEPSASANPTSGEQADA